MELFSKLNSTHIIGYNSYSITNRIPTYTLYNKNHLSSTTSKSSGTTATNGESRVNGGVGGATELKNSRFLPERGRPQNVLNSIRQKRKFWIENFYIFNITENRGYITEFLGWAVPAVLGGPCQRKKSSWQKSSLPQKSQFCQNISMTNLFYFQLPKSWRYKLSKRQFLFSVPIAKPKFEEILQTQQKNFEETFYGNFCVRIAHPLEFFEIKFSFRAETNFPGRLF